jgi:hypothetical protein
MTVKKKCFTDDESNEIIRLRGEGTSIDVIANLLRVGRDRIVRLLKENGMDIYSEKKSPRAGVPQDHKKIYIPIPEFPDALCKSVESELFFPGIIPQARTTKMLYMDKIKQAIDTCMECVHQEDCLNYALKAEPFGIWGGTTEMEREYIRVQLGIECLRELPLSRKNRKDKMMFSNSNLKSLHEEKFSSVAVRNRISQRA